MPSLPTSLIIVGLVAAWLVVLVPMVAKRREHVPESDEDSAGFRVLRRRSETKRRPVLSRTAVGGVGEGWDGDEGRGGPVDEWDEDGEDPEFGDREIDAGGDDGRRATNFVRVEDLRRDRDEDPEDMDRVVSLDRGDQDELPYDEQDESDRWAGDAEREDPSARRVDRVPDHDPRHPPAATYPDEVAEPDWRREPDWEPAAARRPDTRSSRDQGYRRHSDDGRAAEDRRRDREWDDPGRYRPVPVRPGRGGYDPQAAERAKAYRYRQRRRIVLALLVVAVLAAGAGLLGVSLAWAGVAVAVVLLALYLAYLRRQVRIEEDIRRRRAARLERARQIRPVYRASVAEQVRAHRTGGLPRPAPGEEPGGDYRVVSHARPSVPPQYYTRGVPVDLDDDDPVFDDLEYYRAMPYRRAVGE